MTKPVHPKNASARTAAAYLAVLGLARTLGYVITRLKIAKLLYLADLRAIEAGDDPVSGIQWKWLNYGPYNNSLLFLEDELVEAGVVRREPEPYYGGQWLRLIDEASVGYDMEPEEMAVLSSVVAEFGDLLATSLKDLSYQTAPMRDAQGRGRGTTLDLSLARPRPRLTGLAARMQGIINRLPEQENDPGVFEDMIIESAALAAPRRRATRELLGDDE
ncbi:type II toxin-antitoxin system antitoxin SocA domain-containing protein [Micromonospora sp. WMMD980]|uniref:type II toxin-antitoxin system antitoxin SocA domain-containing protein n=1 Tax=Micromonospora sp. WMMD980 TaxID=3016088 RepID=UPI0024171BA0|nr:type II toxin-antitoxin system antitoxin SocA domain-containing protein [Micromonospora sp. WMMD980]MDG4803737.1 DUF4065 domain-containing protein [Micromonospora sp. WMMD980]